MTPPEVESRAAWVVVWACFVALGVIFGVAYSFAAFFEPLQQQFQARRADLSLMFGLSGLLYFTLGAGAGMLADRFGPGRVTSAGMLCIAAGLLACSFAQDLGLVIAAYGVGVGVGIGLVYTPAIGCVQPWFTRRRGLAAGLASAGIGAGTLVVPLLVAALLAAMDWRGALRVLAAGVAVLGLAATLQLRRAPQATAAAGGVVPGTPLRQALRTPAFGWLYAMCLLGAPSMFIPFAHVSAAARDPGCPTCARSAWWADRHRQPDRPLCHRRAGRPHRPAADADADAGLARCVAGAVGRVPAVMAFAVFALWMGLSYGGIVSLMPALVHGLLRRPRGVVDHRRAVHRRGAGQPGRTLAGRRGVRPQRQLPGRDLGLRGAVGAGHAGSLARGGAYAGSAQLTAFASSCASSTAGAMPTR
jgi:hypothetical protein